MSHAQHITAHALYLRVCARALQSGDAEARDEAARLIAQADKLDKKPARKEVSHA
jgi:hypothetical protein